MRNLQRVTVLFAAVAATVLGSVPAASAYDLPEAASQTMSTTAQTMTLAADDEHGTDAHGVQLVPGKAAAPMPAKMLGWDVPSARSYTITASCAPYANQIRQGAAAWNGLTEGGGTPVSCQDGYITDCGAGTVIGCNYGAGQRITLVASAVGDVPLLAAHEFGHDWYGHSGTGCANWNSPADVMRTSICG
ncbi:hypothetical protein [Kribbella sp. NPDC051770]|uniref:hypothetical protein n=1 Tax=Kribbella sp. NPDC051770 TaxID=3155413 RepID=UPI003442F1D5